MDYDQCAAPLTKISNRKEDSEYFPCEEYIAAKILVKLRGIYALDTSNFRDIGSIGSSLCGKAILEEINKDTKLCIERAKGSVEKPTYDEYGFADYEDALPESIMKRYAYLKRQLGEVSESIPHRIIKIYQGLDALVRSQGLFTGRFKANLDVMGQCYGLDEKELRIFGVMILIKCSSIVGDAFNCFCYEAKGVSLLYDVLAEVLDLEKDEVARTLGSKNRLKELELVKEIDYNFYLQFAEDLFKASPTAFSFTKDKYKKDRDPGLDLDYYQRFPLVYSENGPVYTRDLLWKELTADDFLTPWVVNAEAAQNCLEDFYYLPEVKGCIIPLLRELSGVKHSGVNILLHGPSGSGKTELSRVIAKELGFKAYKLSKDIPEKMGRWQAWETASKILRSKPDTLMIVDEAEEFYNNPYDLGSGARVGKGDIIHSLETGTTPVIWITDSLAGMDPSILRRFQFILEVTKPPKEQMQKIAEHKLGKYLSAENIARILNIPQISPTNLNQAGLLAEDLMNSVCPISEDRLMSVIADILKTQGFGEPLQLNL